MRKYLVVLLVLLVNCKSNYDNNKYISIITDYGNIVVKLYNETPNHTNNFIKLANQKFYDNTIFHRVIKDFMIQGGDPDTKKAEKGVLYGESYAGYLIDSEFNDNLFHKKGVIAMARESDDVNPTKKSSSSQFYIVVGKQFTDIELDALEKKRNKKIYETLKRDLFLDYFNDNQETYEQEEIFKIYERIQNKADSVYSSKPKFKFSNLQRKIYTTIGGTPHLDGEYTVFGEVVEGIEVVEKISLLKTDYNDRPIKDIKMKVRVLN